MDLIVCKTAYESLNKKDKATFDKLVGKMKPRWTAGGMMSRVIRIDDYHERTALLQVVDDSFLERVCDLSSLINDAVQLRDARNACSRAVDELATLKKSVKTLRNLMGGDDGNTK